MKKFKLFCINFILFVYVNYIVEDWTIFTKLGKICLYPVWFVRALLIWMVCPFLIPYYFFKKSKMYKEIEKIQNDPQFHMHMSRMINGNLN